MDCYHIPIPTPEFEIDGKKFWKHHTTACHYMNLLVDETERNLEDLDYIPSEKLFSRNKKYKKMVNTYIYNFLTANIK